MEITLEENGTNGRYVHVFDDGSEAELNFQLRHNVMVINHVGVPTQHRNHGLAAKLVKKAIEDAKEKQLKVQPVCPYAAAQFRRHPEWSDLLQ
ncbi:GNAT family N-acetyltransferase [Lentilitoribacter sp. EG35]|jgi:predicted GNAT family acetyltransferase|uniref:GNAT family N-acetyltransferase n=1 Tax=Lentilitoribacter sp. EG35 TaxID=3234192 RepID=UPI00345F21AA